MNIKTLELHIESDFSVNMDVSIIERSPKLDKYSLSNVKKYIKVDEHLFETLILWLIEVENEKVNFKEYLLDVLTDRIEDYESEDYKIIRRTIVDIKDSDTLLDCIDQILLIQNMIHSVFNNKKIQDLVAPSTVVVDEIKSLIQRAKLSYTIFHNRDTTILPLEVAQSDDTTFRYSFYDLTNSKTAYEQSIWNRPILNDYKDNRFTFKENYAIVYNVLFDKWFIWSK